VASSCEDGNEPSGSIEVDTFHDRLRNFLPFTNKTLLLDDG
jgi:hypothetical protein